MIFSLCNRDRCRFDTVNMADISVLLNVGSKKKEKEKEIYK